MGQDSVIWRLSCIIYLNFWSWHSAMHWTFRFPSPPERSKPWPAWTDRRIAIPMQTARRIYTEVRVAHLNPSDSFIYLFDLEFQLLNQKTKLNSWIKLQEQHNIVKSANSWYLRAQISGPGKKNRQTIRLLFDNDWYFAQKPSPFAQRKSSTALDWLVRVPGSKALLASSTIN